MSYPLLAPECWVAAAIRFNIGSLLSGWFNGRFCGEGSQNDGGPGVANEFTALASRPAIRATA